MPVPVYLPKFDPQHEESKVLHWLVAEGDHVTEGDALCEVETDKVNMEVEAPADGRLAAVRYPVGAVAPTATVMAFILLEGESSADVPSLADEAPTTPMTETAPLAEDGIDAQVSPIARRIADSRNIDLNAVSGSGPRGRILRRDVELASPAPSGKVRATPAARRIARKHQVDLGRLNGSGPRGRVQATDAQAAIPAADNGGQTFRLTGMRERIARRMQQSYQTAPHIFVEMPVDMTQSEFLRDQMKAEGDALSITAILLKACARTLKRHPRLNATITENSVTLQPAINPGIAVALDDGLIVPVIHHADRLGLAEIQTRSSDLIARARAGRLEPGDVADGTFTISNLGMFGVSRFTAIINPPQVAILAVGRITRQYVPDENDQPVVRPIMNLVLSVDHRVVDGADAARFLSELRGALEQPLRLLW